VRARRPRPCPAATRLAVTLCVAGVTAAGLAGCSFGSSAGQLTAAPQATGGACVAALAKLPATVLGQHRTPMNVAGATAWGEPAITVRCGLPEQPPTTQECVTIGVVDWVVNDAGDPIIFTTFGRSPAAQVRVPTSYGRENATAALVDLAAVAATLPRTSRSCVGLGDVSTP
jgi:hypothetical protein